jgi:hypothetical protein
MLSDARSGSPERNTDTDFSRGLQRQGDVAVVQLDVALQDVRAEAHHALESESTKGKNPKVESLIHKTEYSSKTVFIKVEVHSTIFRATGQDQYYSNEPITFAVDCAMLLS